MEDKENIQLQIEKLEAEMLAPTFWEDKVRAQRTIQYIAELKNELLGKDKYNKGHAIMTIFSGAGGDDAEDFSRILYEMYSKFFFKNKWDYKVLDETANDHGGYRNITVEILGPNVYGLLKHES